jgi:hypothetical protein
MPAAIVRVTISGLVRVTISGLDSPLPRLLALV